MKKKFKKNCVEQKPIVDELEKDYKDKVVFKRIELKSPEWKEEAPKGKETDRAEGFKERAELEEKIKKLSHYFFFLLNSLEFKRIYLTFFSLY